MSKFRAKQIAAITDAIGEARLALRGSDAIDACAFGEIFVRHGGIQIPGAPAAVDSVARVGEAVLSVLCRGTGVPGDADVAREVARVRREASWLTLARDERLVGFRLAPDSALSKEAGLEPFFKNDRGLGAGVFSKYDIVVLPPEFELYARYDPVYEQDLEW